jgi:hypothetical protein
MEIDERRKRNSRQKESYINPNPKKYKRNLDTLISLSNKVVLRLVQTR